MTEMIFDPHFQSRRKVTRLAEAVGFREQSRSLERPRFDARSPEAGASLRCFRRRSLAVLMKEFREHARPGHGDHSTLGRRRRPLQRRLALQRPKDAL